MFDRIDRRLRSLTSKHQEWRQGGAVAGGVPGCGGAGPKEPSRLPLPVSGGCSSAQGEAWLHGPLLRVRGEALTNSGGLLKSCCSAYRFLLALKAQLKRVACKSGIPWAFQSIPFTTVSVCSVCTTGQWLVLQCGTVTLCCAKPVVLTMLGVRE